MVMETVYCKYAVDQRLKAIAEFLKLLHLAIAKPNVECNFLPNFRHQM